MEGKEKNKDPTLQNVFPFLGFFGWLVIGLFCFLRRLGKVSSSSRKTLIIVPRNAACYPILKMLEIKAGDIASSYTGKYKSEEKERRGH